MIIEAIQATLSPVLTTYSRVAPQEVETPFCVHDADSVPVRTKNGIVGYVYTVRVLLVCASTADIITYTDSIKSALEAIAGTTVSNTAIEAVYFDDDNIEYNTVYGWHENNITFTIETKNR